MTKNFNPEYIKNSQILAVINQKTLLILRKRHEQTLQQVVSTDDTQKDVQQN